MNWKTGSGPGSFSLRESIEIDAAVEQVFDQWSRYEEFARFMESVRRAKCVDEHRVLWDIEIAGRQIVLEARIIENIPERLIRWHTTWSVRNSGTVLFEALPDAPTRLTVEIEYEPRGLLERLGARCGLVDRHVRRDLVHFQRFVESQLRVADERSDESGPAAFRFEVARSPEE